MHNRPAPELRKNGDRQQSPLRPGGKARPFLFFCFMTAFALAMPGFVAHAQPLEPPGPATGSVAPAPHTAQEQTILPHMDLQEALQAFEGNYRAPHSAVRLRELNQEGSQNSIKDLHVLNGKIRAAAKHSREAFPLSPYVHPVSLSRHRLQRWKDALPDGTHPPAVSHQTFAVTFKGSAYVIAPAHGVHGDKRYHASSKSDTAVRLATETEAKHAISLDIRPSELPGRIVTLEGRLLTGESVRIEAPAVRGAELLQVLLPDTRMSFHNWGRGVEVDYERIQIFILPPEWSYPNKLRVHRAAGFSGAPAIERTSQGDAVAGHFIGHRSIKVDNKKITLGIVEDHDAIRAAVERFAAQTAKEANSGAPERPHP
jgi:hypothetical protein